MTYTICINDLNISPNIHFMLQCTFIVAHYEKYFFRSPYKNQIIYVHCTIDGMF